MKKIQNDFKQVFENNQDRCRFFGNVWVGDIDKNGQDYDFARMHEADGRNVMIDDLRDKYSAVVLAYGAIKDRTLGLEHEHTAQGVVPSRRVVNWYTGSLDNDLDLEKEFDLKTSKNVTIIGNGNIFCDMARVLLKQSKEFETTDMPHSVIEALRESKVENV